MRRSHLQINGLLVQQLHECIRQKTSMLTIRDVECFVTTLAVLRDVRGETGDELRRGKVVDALPEPLVRRHNGFLAQFCADKEVHGDGQGLIHSIWTDKAMSARLPCMNDWATHLAWTLRQ